MARSLAVERVMSGQTVGMISMPRQAHIVWRQRAGTPLSSRGGRSRCLVA